MRVRHLKTRNLSPSALLAAVLVALAAGTAAADSIAQGTSPSVAEGKATEVVKESAITNKVKARLAARHYATLATVHVDTDRDGIVWLSGTVNTWDASALAAQIAKDTEGVVAVHNAIVVQ